MDTVARSLVVAAHMTSDGRLQDAVESRDSGWADGLGKRIHEGRLKLDGLWTRARENEFEPSPVTGRQELLENWVRVAIERV